MLNAPDATEQRRSETRLLAPSMHREPPGVLSLTMPLTTGPGTISVAISLGASRQRLSCVVAAFFVETLAAVALLALLVYAFYRHSARLAGLMARRNQHCSAPVGVPVGLHRHPSVVEWGRGTLEYIALATGGSS